jgi:hypothetical protein
MEAKSEGEKKGRMKVEWVGRGKGVNYDGDNSIEKYLQVIGFIV